MTKGKQSPERTLARRIALLDRLPMARQDQPGMTATELLDYLELNGFGCQKRTLERDLDDLTTVGSVWARLGIKLQREHDKVDQRSVRWSHAPGSKVVFGQALSSEEAALLTLIEQELKHFLPTSAYQKVLSYLPRAQGVLSRPGNQALIKFQDRIRILPDGPSKLVPEIRLVHLQEINDALLYQNVIEIDYRPANQPGERSYRLHPVGLVKKGVTYMLLAIKDENLRGADLVNKVQTFHVNRIQSAQREQNTPVDVDLPTLDEALTHGAAANFSRDAVRLLLFFPSTPGATEVCNNFKETPLGVDQVIEEKPDGSRYLAVTIKPDLQLEWMLQGLAHHVRVIEPVDIREKVQVFVKKALNLQIVTN